MKTGAALLAVFSLSLASCASRPDSVDAYSSATLRSGRASVELAVPRKKALIVSLSASEEGSTAKVVAVMTDTLDATVIGPDEATPDTLAEFDLIGFASGVFDQRHHPKILEAAGRVPDSTGKRFFIVSTSGLARVLALRHSFDDSHDALRAVIEARGGAVVGEFNCPGFNANSILKFFGGLNTGRPNRDDLDAARSFAEGLLR